MFGGDFLSFKYDKDHGTKIDNIVISSILDYSHSQWESMYLTSNSTEDDDQAKIFCYPRCNSTETNHKKIQCCLSENSTSTIMHPPPKTVAANNNSNAGEINTELTFLGDDNLAKTFCYASPNPNKTNQTKIQRATSKRRLSEHSTSSIFVHLLRKLL